MGTSDDDTNLSTVRLYADLIKVTSTHLLIYKANFVAIKLGFHKR